MIEAFLHGKLSREQEHLEDLLTSNVFGMLKLTPPQQGLFPFLAQARSVDGSIALFAWLEDANVRASAWVESYEFWPRWTLQSGKRVEPDLALRIKRPGLPDQLIVIEAKFRSGKSSVAGDELALAKDDAEHKAHDQLAREWASLRQQTSHSDTEAVLLYLTPDFCVPRDDISASIEDYRKSFPADLIVPEIHFLSWRDLWESCRSQDGPIFVDLRRLMSRFRLTYFHGINFTRFDADRMIDWRFSVAKRFNWVLPLADSLNSWRFNAWGIQADRSR